LDCSDTYVWILWRSEYEKWRKKKKLGGRGKEEEWTSTANFVRSFFFLSFFLSFFFVEDDGSRGTTDVSLIHDHKIPEQKIMN
jgi:hypothetical protein